MWLVYVILWYTTKFLLSFTLKEAHKRLKCHHLLTWNCLSWLFRSITNSVHSFPFSWWSVVYATIHLVQSKFVQPSYVDLETPYVVLRCPIVNIAFFTVTINKDFAIFAYRASVWQCLLRQSSQIQTENNQHLITQDRVLI